MNKQKAIVILMGLLLAVQVFFVSQVAAQEGTVDSKELERLERLIKEQQQQLDSLQQQMKQLKQTATEAQTQAKEAKSVAEEAENDRAGARLKRALPRVRSGSGSPSQDRSTAR